jgi:hypothetical protein
MSMRARFRFLLAALLFLLFRPLAATGQTTPCKPNELQAALSSAAPVYPAAVALSNDLQKSGIAVRCILASKMDNFFEGLQGAALYRTEQGDFEALFLPREKTFSSLTISEEQSGRQYVYHFTGTPAAATHIEAAHRLYFVKRRNILFLLSDKTSAARLAKF